jgi:hypothetical protein
MNGSADLFIIAHPSLRLDCNFLLHTCISNQDATTKQPESFAPRNDGIILFQVVGHAIV